MEEKVSGILIVIYDLAIDERERINSRYAN